ADLHRANERPFVKAFAEKKMGDFRSVSLWTQQSAASVRSSAQIFAREVKSIPARYFGRGCWQAQVSIAISSPRQASLQVTVETPGGAGGVVYFEYGRDCKIPCIHRGLRVLRAPLVPALTGVLLRA